MTTDSILRGLTLAMLESLSVTTWDEGLQHLMDLKSLRDLALVDTDVTDEGIARLQKTLPSCNIIR